MPTADPSAAETRETAFLCTAGDGLPSLLAANNGPWEVIQAFLRRTPRTQQTRFYVWCADWQDNRAANIRIRTTYQFILKMYWPVRATTAPLAEQEQQAFKSAAALVVERIRGFVNDKTHGGAFLSVGEAPRQPGVHATFEDPEVTIPADKELRGQLLYYADDFEIND